MAIASFFVEAACRNEPMHTNPRLGWVPRSVADEKRHGLVLASYMGKLANIEDPSYYEYTTHTYLHLYLR